MDAAHIRESAGKKKWESNSQKPTGNNSKFQDGLMKRRLMLLPLLLYGMSFTIRANPASRNAGATTNDRRAQAIPAEIQSHLGAGQFQRGLDAVGGGSKRTRLFTERRQWLGAGFKRRSSSFATMYSVKEVIPVPSVF